MMRMDLRSVRLGIRSARLFHQVDEPLEEVVAILRSRTGLRMVLHGEDRLALDSQSFVAAVEERDMCHLYVPGQALGDHTEAVVLAGDLDPARLDVLHGMIGAAMANRHLFRAAAEREGKELVAEADAKDRLLRFHELPQRGHGVCTGRRGVAGSVSEEYPVRLVREDLLRRGGRGHYGDAAAVGGEEPENVAFGAIVDRDYMEAWGLEPAVPLAPTPARFVPPVHLSRRDLLGEVHAFEAGPGARGLERSVVVDLAIGRMYHRASGRATVADAARELARIHAGDPDEPMRFEPATEMLARAPVAGVGNVDAHDEAARRGRQRLDVLGIGPDIADMREGEGDDLPGVGGVGHDLLVAGHRGIEADFAQRPAMGA